MSISVECVFNQEEVATDLTNGVSLSWCFVGVLSHSNLFVALPLLFWQLSSACSVVLAAGMSSSTTITSLDWSCFRAAWSCCLCHFCLLACLSSKLVNYHDPIGVSLFGSGFATTISRAPRSFQRTQSLRHTDIYLPSACLLFGSPSLMVSGNGRRVCYYYFAW